MSNLSTGMLRDPKPRRTCFADARHDREWMKTEAAPRLEAMGYVVVHRNEWDRYLASPVPQPEPMKALRKALEPVWSWFDGDGEIPEPDPLEVVRLAVQELVNDRTELLALRAPQSEPREGRELRRERVGNLIEWLADKLNPEWRDGHGDPSLYLAVSTCVDTIASLRETAAAGGEDAHWLRDRLRCTPGPEGV